MSSLTHQFSDQKFLFRRVHDRWFVSPSPPLISSFCYITIYQTTVPTVKRSLTNQKTFCNRIVNRCNSLDSFLQIINLIMVFVKSQDGKLKRMKYHDPILWRNVWEGLYSLLIWSLQLSIFNINLLCLIALKVVLEESKIRKGKKPGRNLLAHKMSLWLYAR